MSDFDSGDVAQSVVDRTDESDRYSHPHTGFQMNSGHEGGGGGRDAGKISGERRAKKGVCGLVQPETVCFESRILSRYYIYYYYGKLVVVDPREHGLKLAFLTTPQRS